MSGRSALSDALRSNTAKTRCGHGGFQEACGGGFGAGAVGVAGGVLQPSLIPEVASKNSS